MTRPKPNEIEGRYWEYDVKLEMWITKPTQETLEENDTRHKDRETIEFQAAYTIFDKYRRSKNLDHTDLRNLVSSAQRISTERIAKGKIPNLDFLTQEVGKHLKA